VGLSQPTLSRIERGEVSPVYVQAQALAGSLGLTVVQLEAYVDRAIDVARAAAVAQKGANHEWWAGLGGVARAALVAFAVAVVVGENP
jgi:transcriptional regulator with XRE-family HTH domain